MTNLEALIAALPVTFSATSMDKALIDAGIIAAGTYTANNVQAIDLVAIVLVERLLASPDISEGDYSIKYDRNAILIWLGFIKDKYGLGAKPTIKGIHVW